jgi:hypothetical protein
VDTSATATVVLASTENIREVAVWLVDNITTEQTSINVLPSAACVRANPTDHPGYFGKVGMRYFHERKVCGCLRMSVDN